MVYLSLLVKYAAIKMTAINYHYYYGCTALFKLLLLSVLHLLSSLSESLSLSVSCCSEKNPYKSEISKTKCCKSEVSKTVP